MNELIKLYKSEFHDIQMPNGQKLRRCDLEHLPTVYLTYPKYTLEHGLRSTLMRCKLHEKYGLAFELDEDDFPNGRVHAYPASTTQFSDVTAKDVNQIYEFMPKIVAEAESSRNTATHILLILLAVIAAVTAIILLGRPLMHDPAFLMVAMIALVFGGGIAAIMLLGSVFAVIFHVR